MKSKLADATLPSVNENASFTLKTDASDVTVSAVLQQNGRPVAFWSRTLNSKTKNVIQALKRKLQLLLKRSGDGALFIPSQIYIIKDQNSVAFVFGNSRHNKIKYDKIMRWRIELSQNCSDYCQEKFTVVFDALSRVYCTATTVNTLYRIHAGLCHPGVTRIYHYIRQRNLPYSLDDVKK